MFDEMRGANGVRPSFKAVAGRIERSGLDLLRHRSADAEAIFRRTEVRIAVGQSQQ